MENILKPAMYGFIIYLFISSTIWYNLVLKKMNFVDEMENIKTSGCIFNAAVLCMSLIMIGMLVDKQLI